MNKTLTVAARATIMDACQSISRNADALKECHTVDGDWGDDLDAKAIYDAELCLLERLTALLATQQPEPRDAIARSKRILDLVDSYHENPTQHTRTALRAALMDEFQPEPRAEVTDDEGCTPADARMLRAANHALAAENDALRRALRPFASIVSTDQLSWAMVEYCVDGDPEKQTFQRPQMQRAFNRAADLFRDNAPSETLTDNDEIDAERYRWLRKQYWHESSLFVVAGGKSRIQLGTDCPADERLDTAIDAARAGEGQ